MSNRDKDRKYLPTATNKVCLFLKAGGLLAHHSVNVTPVNRRSNEHIKQGKQNCYLGNITGEKYSRKQELEFPENKTKQTKQEVRNS